ncbi:hypothetical protein GCM10010254_11350 [Streptomyces chromofuscus]|nr:hypothetical protein GCM10010254_11350 [Streptomyces chromofuscus]
MPYGLGGVGVGVICLAGAVVSAVTGHPWLALTVLAAATVLIGMAAALILQEGRFELTPGQAEIVAVAGSVVTAACGLALLVLGPLVALTTSGDVVHRVTGGGAIAFFGGVGIWIAAEVDGAGPSRIQRPAHRARRGVDLHPLRRPVTPTRPRPPWSARPEAA